jgi:hypothetical protein
MYHNDQFVAYFVLDVSLKRYENKGKFAILRLEFKSSVDQISGGNYCETITGQAYLSISIRGAL